MTYCIAGGKTFNMVLSHVDHSNPATWSDDTAVSDMRANFAQWDPKYVLFGYLYFQDLHLTPNSLAQA